MNGTMMFKGTKIKTVHGHEVWKRDGSEKGERYLVVMPAGWCVWLKNLRKVDQFIEGRLNPPKGLLAFPRIPKSNFFAAALLMMTILFPAPARAEDFGKIVDAIWVIEGGTRAKVPYGILSVKCSSKEECRRICFNTVRNNFRRWEKAGRPGQYLDFLADRYCPSSVDPVGNRNWKSNIKRMVRS